MFTTVWSIFTKLGMIAQNVSVKCTNRQKLILKIQDGGRPIRFRDPFCIIMIYCNFSIFKMATVHYLGILKLKFFNNRAHQIHFLRIIKLSFLKIGHTPTVTEMSQFFAGSVMMWCGTRINIDVLPHHLAAFRHQFTDLITSCHAHVKVRDAENI